MSSATCRAAASGYAHEGLAPIPLKERSKQTNLRQLAPYLKRRATTEELSSWSWHGVGIVTGAVSGILVLDVDGPEGEAELKERGHPPTPMVRTGGEGLHLYFRHPGGDLRTGIRVAPGLDVKAGGGYVVAPPSVGPTGGAYEWLVAPWEAEFADPPGWLMRLITEGSRRNGGAAPVAEQIPSGRRNQELTSYAGTMRRRGASEEAIRAALEVENRLRCDPPLEEEEVHNIAASVARYAPAPDRPRGPLREEGPAKGGEDTPSTNGRGSARLDPEDRRGLTVTLAEAIQERRHFAKDAGGELYHYEGGVYCPGGNERVAVEVKRLLAESNISAKWSTHRSKEVAEYIRVDAPRLWEQPPAGQVNVLNGIFEVETEVLSPHTPDFLSPVQLPVLYDPAADCPAWDRFISETFPPDARQLAYEIPAWLATPDTSIQKAILLLGEGANGKSTYLAALGAFIGRENYATLSLQKIEDDRFAAARLVAKLANICPDLPSDHLSSTSTFKAITGGDPISAEYKYGSSFDLRPFARLVFSANHPPRSGDASHAFYRRWLVVPFDQNFEPAEQRPRAELDAELAQPRELSGVLNRALAALRGIRRRGGFSESRSTRDALGEFQKTTDPLSVWLDRNTTEHTEAMVSQDELRRAFNQFAENSGKPGLTPQSFGRALARVKPGIEKGQRTWQGISNTRVYLGIGLRSEALEDQPAQRDQRNDPNCFKEEDGGIIENNKSQRVDRVEYPAAELSVAGALQVLEDPNTGAYKNALLYSAGETALEYLVRSVLFAKGIPSENWQHDAGVVEEAFEEWRKRGL